MLWVENIFILQCMFKYFLLWFPMLMIAIGNGALREFVFKKYVSEITAHQLSTITLIIFFTCYTGFIVSRFPPSSEVQAIFIGLMWLVLTLVFEFGFGRYRGNSWEKLFEDYNLWKGRLWVFIPIWVAVAPYILHRALR
jgi:hypothetical protein